MANITRCFWNGTLHSRKAFKAIAVFVAWVGGQFSAMDLAVTGNPLFKAIQERDNA